MESCARAVPICKITCVKNIKMMKSCNAEGARIFGSYFSNCTVLFLKTFILLWSIDS